MLTPTFALNFSSGTLDPRVTFSRALDTATYVNSSGLIQTALADTARFDYDPLTLAIRGLLVEESRTNLTTYSEDVTNAAWGKNGLLAFGSGSVANAEIAPTGAQTADKIVEDTSSGVHRVSFTATLAANTTYTYSLFAKAAGRTKFIAGRFSATVQPSFSHTFDLVAGTVTGGGFIQNFGNGWFRCYGTFTTTATAGQGGVYATMLDAAGVAGYVGDGVSGICPWGSQIEQGASPSSYIPNLATGTKTRNADVATITGTSFSDFWQASKGGVLVRARPGTVSGVRPWLQFDDGTANEIIALRGNITNPELYIVDGGVAQAQIDAGTIAANTDYSLTGWWATNDCKARLDSGAVVTDTSATIPTVTQARLGSDGTNYLNGHLASISYYESFSEQIYTRRKNKAVFNLM